MLQLHRGGAPKNVDRDGNPPVGLVDGLHIALEILKCTFLDPHSITRLEWNRRLDLFGIFFFRIGRLDDPTRLPPATSVLVCRRLR